MAMLSGSTFSASVRWGGVFFGFLLETTWGIRVHGQLNVNLR